MTLPRTPSWWPGETSRQALRDPDRFDAWLHRVLVHTCYRTAQRARRRIEVEGQVRPIETRDPGEQSVLKDEIERGFARLSVEHRTVLVLHHYLGYTFPEIAMTLGIPRGDGQIAHPSRHRGHARVALRAPRIAATPPA